MIDFQNANEIFDVYGLYPHPVHGHDQSTLLGRFLVQDGKLQVIEDHNGTLSRMLKDGPVGHNTAQLMALEHSAYVKVVSESEVAQGHHVELVPKGENPNPTGPQAGSPPSEVEGVDTTEAPESFSQEEPKFTMTTPPAVFDYIRTGMREPQVIKVVGNDVFMNDHKLTAQEVNEVLNTVHTGIGKLKYRKAL